MLQQSMGPRQASEGGSDTAFVKSEIDNELLLRQITQYWNALKDCNATELVISMVANPNLGVNKIISLSERDKADLRPKGVDFPQGSTPLILAAKFSRYDVVQELINAGADINVQDSDPTSRATALHIAVAAGDFPTIKTILYTIPAPSTNLCDHAGHTALHIAAEKGYIEVVELLIEKGSKVDSIDNRSWTPLHRAAYMGHTDVVKALVGRGAVVSPFDNMGCSPLHRAAMRGETSVMEFLLACGTDIEAADTDGCTPLYWASDLGSQEGVLLLLNHGANTEVLGIGRSTALQNAARRGHTNTVEILMDNGAEVDAKDCNGLTSLHMAAFGRHLECAVVLAAEGADLMATNNRGIPPSGIYKGDTDGKLFKLLNRQKTM